MRCRRVVLAVAVLGAILVAPAAAYKLKLTDPPEATVGRAYRFQFETVGGSGPHSFRMFAGGLPAGLSFSSTGVITGTPKEAGSYGFWIEASDSIRSKTQHRFTLDVKPGSGATSGGGGASPPPPVPATPLTVRPDSVPPAAVGLAYRATLRVWGGTVRDWAIVSGTLPAGLTFAGGVVQGTPTQIGRASLGVRASDGTRSATTVLTITVAGPMRVRVPRLPPIVVGETFSVQTTVQGGAPPFRWALEGATSGQAGVVPQAGTIGGAGRVPGTERFRVVVTDAAGQVTRAGVKLVVVAYPAIPTTVLPAPVSGAPYRASVKVAGGLGPFQWEARTTLPPWLRLDPKTGRLSGTSPVGSPAARLAFEVTDVRGNVASGSLLLPAATTQPARSASRSR